MKALVITVLSLTLFAACGGEPANPGKPAPSNTWSEATLELLETLPVQDGGRIKPLSTFARYQLLGMSGRTKAKTAAKDGRKMSATAWLLDCLFTPQVAAEYPVLLVRNDEVLTAIGVPHAGRKKSDRYSYAEIAPGKQSLMRLYSQYVRIEPKDRSSVEEQVVFLGEQFFALESLLSTLPGLRTGQVVGRALAVFPPSGDPAAAKQWMTPVEVRAALMKDPKDLTAQGSLLGTVAEVYSDPTNAATADSKMKDLHAGITGLARSRGEYGSIELEVSYYRGGWLHWSLGFFAIGFLLVLFALLLPRFRPLYWGANVTALAAVVFVTIGITLRCIIQGRPPVTTLYETILFVTATATLTALIIEWINRRRVALFMAAALGLLGMFVAMRYEVKEGRDTMPSLVAVLDTNFWLATHVTTVTLGYAAGLLAAAIAHIYVIGRCFTPWGSDQTYRSIARMIYGIICFGLFFSIVGTILGGIWANESWGRFWGWDPKENGALMIVLWELAMLHARLGGYIKDFGFAMAAIFGGIVVAFSWWGVNLLSVGLHSYGFTSGIQLILLSYYGFEILILLAGGIAWYLNRSKVVPADQR